MDDDAELTDQTDTDNEGEEEPDEQDIIDELYGADEDDKEVRINFYAEQILCFIVHFYPIIW